MSLIASQTKCGWIKVVNSTIDQQNLGCRNMIFKAMSVVAEIFIITLKKKFYKHMTLVSKNVYINKLADIGNKYNKT